MQQKIYLLKPQISKFEIEFVNEAFNSNWITTEGTNINGFEDDIQKYISSKKEILALNSGTAAIHLALILLGVKKNDEVICQSFTFCASANPILYLGANPIFVDSEKETWNMSPFFLRKAIKDRIKKKIKPKAIIVVNSYGMPAKWDELNSISKEFEIPILEDAAAALGSKYDNKFCGTLGDLSVLSFNGNKIVTTSSGGALICKNIETKNRGLYLATQAKEKENYYSHTEYGYNYRMSNVLAGIGRGQMKRIDEIIIKKRLINDFYKKILKDFTDIDLHSESSKVFFSNFWLNCILFKDNRDIQELILKFKKNNIDVRRLWKPLHKQKYFEDYPFYGDNLCLDLFNRGLCLPSSSNLTKLDVFRICDILL